MKYKYTIISIIALGIFSSPNCALTETKETPNIQHNITNLKNPFVSLSHQSIYGLNSHKNSKISSKNQKETDIQNYTAIIMAAPQAWRLQSGNPNLENNRIPWIKKNNEVARAIKSHKVAFYIVNDDLIELSQQKTYDDYADAYKNLGSSVYERLGNHDYANNVADCTIPKVLNFFRDACAISAAVKNAKRNVTIQQNSFPF